MSGIEAGIALVIVILLLVYLVIALLKPEKF
ncbi:MAG: K(+)-transporting ATPase subunit F [Candidatus Nanopelagicales bacterium]|jgi:K+-transporting ATPase KdpF subunit